MWYASSCSGTTATIGCSGSGSGGISNISSASLRSRSSPRVPDLLAPVVVTPPLQLLAYHVAKVRGCDVDQPRNLAKSVTVE